MVEHPTNWSNFEMCQDARDLSLVDMLHSDSLKDFACLTWALSLYLLPMSFGICRLVWAKNPIFDKTPSPNPLGNSCPFPRSCGMNGHPGWKVSKILFFKTWLWSHKRRGAGLHGDGGSAASSHHAASQVKFKLPPTKEFDMPYPEPFKLATDS